MTRKYVAILLFLFLFYSQSIISAYAKDKLIFASEIIRHGDRTPQTILPTAPYDWPEGLGELTAIGMQQEFKLGEAFRKFYITQEKLLPNNYDPKTIHIRSSDFNRTIASAQSVLLGLYPLGTGPKLPGNEYALAQGFQPIPVHTIEPAQDDLLVAHDTKRAEFNRLVEATVYKTPRWQRENIQLATSFQKWSKALNIPINNLDDIFSIGDNLYIRQLHLAPMPKKLSRQDINEIIYWAAVVQAEEYMPRKIGALTGKNLLVKLREQMKEKINQQEQATSNLNQKTPDFILYSGHDISLLALMSALGAPLKLNPPYASHISIRLFKATVINKPSGKPSDKHTSKNRYYFTVLLNNKTTLIPDCNNSNQCTLSQLNIIIDQLG